MGFDKEILKANDSGAQVIKGQTVTVHCTGKLSDGTKFWSTKDPGQQPFTFQVGMGKVIKGWDEGCLTMKVGEEAKLTCSPDYAYGASGFPAWKIPPNATLVFEIEVLEAK